VTDRFPVTLGDAEPRELAIAADVLTAAFTDGAVIAWAEPDPAARPLLLRPYFTMLLEHATQHGQVRVACHQDEICAVAVWYQNPPAAGADHHDLALPEDMPFTPAVERLMLLEKTLERQRPASLHRHLSYLGVRDDLRNNGIGSQLVTDQLTNLGQLGLPAYLEANDPRNRELYRRLGFRDRHQPISVAGSPPVQPMWHPAATPGMPRHPLHRP
jgi:GNAT superfamily N-acetyltransferase